VLGGERELMDDEPEGWDVAHWVKKLVGFTLAGAFFGAVIGLSSDGSGSLRDQVLGWAAVGAVYSCVANGSA
jgi:hypothetical protein